MHIQDVNDIPEYTRKEIEHFFARYKDLEPGKFVKVEKWGSAADADRMIQESIERLKVEGH
jgi:inorganic pyrophosphatase